MTGRNVRVARRVHPTALVYCEGAHELAFIRHLKKIYSSSNAAKTHFNTLQGGGGSQDRLVADALRIPGDFDRVLIKLDNDRPKAEMNKATIAAVEATTSQRQVTIQRSNPCLDALLLSILNPGIDYSHWEAKACKREFESVITKDNRTSPMAYERIFGRDMLEKARKRIVELDELIRFLES